MGMPADDQLHRELIVVVMAPVSGLPLGAATNGEVKAVCLENKHAGIRITEGFNPVAADGCRQRKSVTLSASTRQ